MSTTNTITNTIKQHVNNKPVYTNHINHTLSRLFSTHNNSNVSSQSTQPIRYTTNQQVKQYQSNRISTYRYRYQQAAQQHSSNNNHTTDSSTTQQHAVDPKEFCSVRTGLLPPTLTDVHSTFGQINEIQQADTYCMSGEFTKAIPLLQRVIEISVSLRDSLVSVYSRMLLARCYYLNNQLAEEKYERNEIIKLLDQLIKEQKDISNMNDDVKQINTVHINNTTELLNDTIMFKQAISSYAINLIRMGSYDECLELINKWSIRAHSYNAHDANVRSKAISGIIHMMLKDITQAERCFEDMYNIANQNMLSDKLLVEADSQVLLGLLHKYVSNDNNKSMKCFQRAVRVYGKMSNPIVPLDAGGIQIPICYPLLYIATEDSVKQALQISEQHLGLTHWVSIDSVRVLAGIYRNNDPLTAEGLYRTAINRIDNCSPYVQSAEYWYVLADVLVDYADLLVNMTWNNKPRIQEANKLIERLNTLTSTHQHIKPTVRHVIKQDGNNDVPFELQVNKEPFIPSWFYERFTA